MGTTLRTVARSLGHPNLGRVLAVAERLGIRVELSTPHYADTRVRTTTRRWYRKLTTAEARAVTKECIRLYSKHL